MRKTLLTLASVLLLGSASYAQNAWVNMSAGTTLPTGLLCRQVTAVNAATVWAIYGEPATTTNTNPPIRYVVRSADGGTTWTGGSVGIPTGLNVCGITAIDGNTAWIAAYGPLATQGVYKTTDGGVTWTKQTTAAYSSATSFPNGVYFFDANNGVTWGDPVSGRFEIYTTTNGGTNWVRNNNAPTALAADEYGLVESFYGLTTGSQNTIWWGGYSESGLGARLFRSTDGGLTWNAYNTPFAESITNIAFSSQTNGLVADVTDLASTTNGGVTTTALAYTGNFRGRGVDAIPGIPGAYVSVGVPADSTSRSNGSSVSFNNGATWTNMNSPLVNINQYGVDMVSSASGYTGTFTQGTAAAPTVNVVGVWKLNRVITGSKNSAVLAGGLQVFPNPSNDGRFMFNVNMVSKQRDVTVTDALGRVVKQMSLASTGSTVQNQVLDLSQCKAGIYNVRLETEHGTAVEKLVIQ